MFSLSCLLESRNCLLHFRTCLGRKWSLPTFSSMAIGRFLNRELRHQEVATSRCSARQNWSTERAFHSPQCTKEMSQKEIWRYSQSLPKRFNLSWFAAPTLAGLRRRALRWTNQHRKSILIVHCLKNSKEKGKLVYHTEPIKKKCTHKTPIRFSEKHLQIWTVSTVNPKKKRLESILCYQYQRWHSSSSSSSTSWWQRGEYWWSS